jgi:prepilin-type N-terminal cleavage/methylation domain-containing protein
MRPITSQRLASAAGYSLLELVVTMAIFGVIMGATMTGLSDVIKGNETVLQMANMNNAIRTGMDLMVRDFLQVGSGLPSSHAISIPNGAGAQPVKIPGPPGTNFTISDLTIPAVIPNPRRGPTINGVQTDVITVLMADNAFLDIRLSAVTNTSVTVVAGTNLDVGPDRVTTGQLMMIQKGSFNTLVQVTAVNVAARQLVFASGDSLMLNQPAAEAGNLTSLNAEAPSLADDAATAAAATRVTRVRMITYYLQATTDPARPRLVRRINNGDPTVFDNNLGTAVALDTTDLQFAYDISNGTGNPGDVEMMPADMAGSGACSPNPCSSTQVRKVNVTLTGRSSTKVPPRMTYIYNTLESQVSLRGMAFVDKYR